MSIRVGFRNGWSLADLASRLPPSVRTGKHLFFVLLHWSVLDAALVYLTRQQETLIAQMRLEDGTVLWYFKGERLDKCPSGPMHYTAEDRAAVARRYQEDPARGLPVQARPSVVRAVNKH
jgi:hypothetical protein